MPDVRVHPAMRSVLLAFGGYKRLASSAFASALDCPNPVRRSGFDLNLVVETVERAARDAVSLTLMAPDRGDLPRWLPSAHLDVFLPSGRQRQYSLCGNRHDRRRYRIAVRLIPGGGGSREIHERVRTGDTLRIRGPRNAFRMVDAPSYHFVAVEISAPAQEEFLSRMRRRVGSTMFLSPACAGTSTYYVDKHGDAPFLRPTSGPQAWLAQHRFSVDDYEYETHVLAVDRL